MNALEKRHVAHQPDPVLACLIGQLDRGICLVDADLRVVACNAVFLELLGCPEELGSPGAAYAELIGWDGGDGPLGAAGIALHHRSSEPGRAAPWTAVAGGPAGQPLQLTTVPLDDGWFVQICTPAVAEQAAVAVPEPGELQRYRDYAEASSNWFWETDRDLRFSHLTPRFSDSVGLAPEDVVGSSLDDLVEQGYLSSIEHAACRQAMRAGVPFRDVCYTATGSHFDTKPLIKLSGEPIVDADGGFAGYRGSGADVTIEYGAVQRADEVGRHLDAAIEAFSEGLALFDAQDRLIFCNRQFRTFHPSVADAIVPGMLFEDMVRLKVEAGIFATEGQDPDEIIERCLDLHLNAGQSYEVRLKNGRWLRATDRRTADGGIVSVRTDITELKRREASLTRLSDEVRTQMMRFDTALNNMIQGLCMFDAQQRLIVCNERYLEMYGFSPEVVKPGIAIREIMEYSVALGNYSAEDAERAISERPMHAARRDQATLLQRLRDGRIIAVIHKPMPAGGSLATYEDVTERMRAEEAMRAYASKLEQSNRELQNFASIASHDLQEPLRKIEAFGDRLAAKYADRLDDAGKMYIDRMQNAAGRMRTLINDLLSYSRVTSKAAPFRALDLKAVAEEVGSDLQITLEQAEGRLEIGDLPSIEADPTQIRQLLQNLISNALKFRKADVAPVVTVSGRMVRPAELDLQFERGPSGLCEILVRDNGIGFDMKYAERIFGIFQRLHGRNEYDGTGIGLATCRKIAQRHHGAIRAESTPGEGTTFIIELPARQAANAE